MSIDTSPCEFSLKPLGGPVVADAAEFVRAFQTVPRGTWIRYHIGNLASDREIYGFFGIELFATADRIDELARVVWESYRDKQVTLVQCKRRKGGYLYYAVKL